MGSAGAIDTLCETVLTLHALRNELTDNMVERLFTFFEQMINTVGNEAMGEPAGAEHSFGLRGGSRGDGAGEAGWRPVRHASDVVQAGGAAQPCVLARLWRKIAAERYRRLNPRCTSNAGGLRPLAPSLRLGTIVPNGMPWLHFC